METFDIIWNTIQYNECFAVLPPLVAAALISAGAGLVSGGVSSATASKRNKDEKALREEELKEANKMSIENRRSEDSDKVYSLKKAGMNPALAYGGATSVTQSPNPASVEDVGKGMSDSIQSSGSQIASMVQQQPTLDAGIELSQSQSDLAKAQAQKTKADAEKTELENADKRGENLASQYKLSAFGIKPDDLDVSMSTGYLRSLDFADEYHTKGFERRLRSVSASIDAQFNELIDTNPDFKKRYQDAQLAKLDNFVEIAKGNRLSNILKSQEVSLYSLRKASMEQSLRKGQEEINNLVVNREKISADIQIAHENSYLTIFTNCANALRSKDAEKFSYWNTIGAIKSGKFDSWSKNFMMSINNTVPSGVTDVFKSIADEVSLYDPRRGKTAKKSYEFENKGNVGMYSRQLNGYVKTYGRFPYEKH